MPYPFPCKAFTGRKSNKISTYMNEKAAVNTAALKYF